MHHWRLMLSPWSGSQSCTIVVAKELGSWIMPGCGGRRRTAAAVRTLYQPESCPAGCLHSGGHDSRRCRPLNYLADRALDFSWWDRIIRPLRIICNRLQLFHGGSITAWYRQTYRIEMDDNGNGSKEIKGLHDRFAPNDAFITMFSVVTGDAIGILPICAENAESL